MNLNWIESYNDLFIAMDVEKVAIDGWYEVCWVLMSDIESLRLEIEANKFIFERAKPIYFGGVVSNVILIESAIIREDLYICSRKYNQEGILLRRMAAYAG